LDRDAIEDLAVRLESIGVDTRLVGDISADLGDLRDALTSIAESYDLIASGRPHGPLLDNIESEARDHMHGHIRSIVKTVEKIRGEWRGLPPRG
jgi:hypothetical protein